MNKPTKALLSQQLDEANEELARYRETYPLRCEELKAALVALAEVVEVVEETIPIYTVQCNFPKDPHIWTNVITGNEFKDEDDAREHMNRVMVLYDDSSSFRIIKTTTTICVIAEKAHENQS